MGGVTGLVASSLIASPFIGSLYQLAGYVVGFASADTCRKADSPLEARPSEEKARPTMTSKIGEENL